MNKYKLAKKINDLDGLTNDEKSELLKLLRSQKKYGLVWEDKPENAELKMVDEMPVLEEVPERAIISDDAEAPNHILIEGDNLEALTALSYTHTGKIDVIYIDPPYNTGNKDFTYNDNYVDMNDEFRHSKWLSFMSKRLKLAKRLLSEKGILFISIDENEVAQLRMLGDSLFSESNFVGQWNWFKSATPPALSKKNKRTVEYILSWKVSANDEKFQGAKKVSKSNDPFTKPQNSYKTLYFPKGSITCPKQNGILKAGVYGTEKFPNELLDDLVIENEKNANGVRFKNRFIWLQETLTQNIEDGLYIELSKKGVLSYKRTNYSPEVPPNFIDSNVGVDTTENAGRMLLDIFNNNSPFKYPKPVSLIKYLVNFTNDKNLTVLDSFAGSGTTMHAVMQLNKEDGGHRQCILVQGIERDEHGNDKRICENVTYERNRRVIQGYATPKGEAVPGLTHNNLRYYKTKFVPRDKTTKNLRDLMKLSTDMLCIRNDAYTEKTFAGKNINKNIARYFESSDGQKRMLVIYREEAIAAIVQLLRQTVEQEMNNHTVGGNVAKKKFLVYVFSPNGYAYDDEFEDVADHVELCALPDALLNAYRRVLPKRKPQLLPDAELTETESGEAVGMGALESREQDLFDFNNNQEIGMAASEIQNK